MPLDQLGAGSLLTLQKNLALDFLTPEAHNVDSARIQTS